MKESEHPTIVEAIEAAIAGRGLAASANLQEKAAANLAVKAKLADCNRRLRPERTQYFGVLYFIKAEPRCHEKAAFGGLTHGNSGLSFRPQRTTTLHVTVIVNFSSVCGATS